MNRTMYRRSVQIAALLAIAVVTFCSPLSTYAAGTVTIPIHTPTQVCGTTNPLLAALNPSLGTTCVTS